MRAEEERSGRPGSLGGAALRGLASTALLLFGILLSLTVAGAAPGQAPKLAAVAVAGLLWRALFAGRIVSTDVVAELVRPRSDVPRGGRRYGLGFWLDQSSDVVMLEGSDAGVSFRCSVFAALHRRHPKRPALCAFAFLIRDRFLENVEAIHLPGYR